MGSAGAPGPGAPRGRTSSIPKSKLLVTDVLRALVGRAREPERRPRLPEFHSEVRELEGDF